MWSCSDDDEVITDKSLPAEAKAFLSSYFPSETIYSATKDHDEYDVVLSDGTEVNFYKSGEWKSVDAIDGKTIPSGYYPSQIDDYVKENFEGNGINGIEKEKRGYEVELVTGVDVLFSQTGEYLGLDMN